MLVRTTGQFTVREIYGNVIYTVRQQVKAHTRRKHLGGPNKVNWGFQPNSTNEQGSDSSVHRGRIGIMTNPSPS